MHCQRNLRIIYIKDLHLIKDERNISEDVLDSTYFHAPNWPLDHISSNFKSFVMTNPSGNNEDPAFYIYYQDNIPVARLCTFADTLVIDNNRYRWGWVSDLKVHNKFRRQGIASEFIKSVLEHMNHIGWIYGGFGIAPAARKIYKKYNFIEIGRIPRYVGLLSANPILNFLKGRGYVARVLGLPVRALLSLIKPITQKSKDILAEVTNFDQGLLTMFLRSHSKCNFLKNPEILNWKLLIGQKSEKFKYRAFQMRLSSQIIGWYVARFAYFAEYPGHAWIKEINVCTILEVGMDPEVDNKWNRFLNLAIRTAVEYNSDVLEIYTSDRLFQRSLKRRLFKRIGGEDFMFKPPEQNFLPLDIWKNNQEWILYKGDSDGFFSV